MERSDVPGRLRLSVSYSPGSVHFDWWRSQHLHNICTTYLPLFRSTKYLDTSHFWSGGIGSPPRMLCMHASLYRFRRPARERLHQESTIWLAILCVPLESEIQGLDVIRMARMLLYTGKVLLWDNSLYCDSLCHTGTKTMLFQSKLYPRQRY